MKKRYFNILKVTIGLLIIFFLIYKFGLDNIFSTILDVKPGFLFIALIFYFVSIFIGVLNIKLLIAPLNKKISYWNLFRYYMFSWSAGLLVPGKIGEFSICYFLKKHDISIGEGIAASLMDKIITFVFLLIFSLFGFFIFLDFYSALLSVMVIPCILVTFLVSLYSMRIRNIIKRFIPNKIADKFKGFSRLLNRYAKDYKMLLFLNFLITGIKWFISFLVIYYMFLSFNVHVALGVVIIITAITKIIALIPISISGLGIREGAAVYLFGLYGVESVAVLSAFLTIVVLNYLLAAASFSLIKKEDFIKK